MKLSKLNLVFFIVCFSIICSYSAEPAPSSVKATTEEALKLLHWYGQSSFRFDGPPVIYIDPWEIPKEMPKADIVLITHSHRDHLSPDDVAEIQTENTMIVAPSDCLEKLEGNKKSILPNQTVKLSGLNISTVPAYNISAPFHPRNNNWVGYVIEWKGLKIYHGGDTDAIPEMKDIKPDIAMIPIGGKYTMDMADASKAAKWFENCVIIPMHYGKVVGTPEDGIKFKNEVGPQVKVMEIETR